MRKLLVFTSLALVSAAFAAAPFLTVGASPADELTAHWQAYDEGGEDTAACVVDDTDEYGLGDKTWMYNTDPLDLSDFVSGTFYFAYKLDTADSNDFFAVYGVNYEPVAGDFDPDAETPLAVYDTNQEDWKVETFDLEDFLGEDEVYVVFYWESDAEGVADGVRINYAGFRVWDGESMDWTQILRWDEDHHAYGPGEAVNLDISDGAGGTVAIDFHYDDGSLWAWWCQVDQVVISDDTRAELLNEQFEGSFPPDGWDVYNVGTYGWQNNSYGRTNYAGGSGYCASADSDWWYAGVNTHLYTPGVDASGSSELYLDFYASYNDISGGSYDYFEVLLGVAEEYTEEEDFEDLDGWSTVDEGEYLTVEHTSWGGIKASF